MNYYKKFKVKPGDREALKMEFPKPTVDIGAIREKFHRAQEEKNNE